MVLRKLRLFIARMKQDGLIFPLKEVQPCEMRQDETFNNRVPLEIEVFDSDEAKNNHTPTYIIRAGADSYIKPERTLSLMKHIKNLRSELVIEHADHNFGGENPDILNALRFGVGAMLTNFLNDALVKNNS